MAREQEARITHLEDQIAKLGLRQSEQRPAPMPGAAITVAPVIEEAAPAPEPVVQPRPAPELLVIEPVPMVTVPRTEMADVLQAARGKVVNVPEEKPRDGGQAPALAGDRRAVADGAVPLCRTDPGRHRQRHPAAGQWRGLSPCRRRAAAATAGARRRGRSAGPGQAGAGLSARRGRGERRRRRRALERAGRRSRPARGAIHAGHALWTGCGR